VKIGLAISPGFGVDQSPHDQMRERVDLVRAAREAGFSSIAMGEHYLAAPYPYFQNIPLLARLAAEADGLDVYGVVVLSLHHPVEVAEQVATLDIICGGRFRLVVGMGWRQTEFQIFRVPREHRVRHFLEQIALIRKCWTEREFTFDGEFYQIPEPVSSLRPLQPGGPPILLGPSSEPMARRMARVGDGWMGSGHTTWAGMETIVDAYHAELTRLGKPVPPEHCVIRHVYVARDRATALRDAAPFIAEYYRQFGGWGLFRDISTTGGEPPDVDAVLRGRVVLGDPDEVAAELRRYHARFGVDHFVCRIGWQGMDNRLIAESIRLCGTEVLPRLNAWRAPQPGGGAASPRPTAK
jgi:alkanesulfonate monooxygenase SsuD/methylene tetrahydromethanopterin reductase-like flavin-dependent oxidoreductase (luciferase family)